MLTFCLKELRAICSFCDYLSIPLRAIFESAGVPIIFLVQADDFSADFVMSTVNNEGLRISFHCHDLLILKLSRWCRQCQ